MNVPNTTRPRNTITPANALMDVDAVGKLTTGTVPGVDEPPSRLSCRRIMDDGDEPDSADSCLVKGEKPA